jgi:DNA polymerase-3 subunit delta'
MMKFLDIIKNTAAYALLLNDFKSGLDTHAYEIICPDGEFLEEFLQVAACIAVCPDVAGAGDLGKGGVTPAAANDRAAHARAASVAPTAHTATTASAAEPCFTCRDCKRAINRTHSDIKHLPEFNKRIMTEDIVSLIAGSYLKPAEGKNKIFILHDFCLAVEKAQNKLLKTLEEPPADTILFLGVKNPSAVPATISSRCKKIFINRAFQNADAPKMVDDVAEMFLHLQKSGDILNAADRLIKYKDCFGDVLHIMQTFANDILYFKTNNRNLILYTDRKDDIMFLSGQFSVAALTEILENIDKVKKNLEFNVNVSAVADNLLYGILEVKHRCPT